MPSKEKYRGTPVYHLVHAELVTAAQYRGTVTYQELAQIMGLPVVGSYMGSEIGHILGEISEDEANNGRPMLSAVAVSKAGHAGPGFFDLARDLGRLTGSSPEDELAFWQAERQQAYTTWQRRIYTAKAKKEATQ
jgi:hypothetical protein